MTSLLDEARMAEDEREMVAGDEGGEGEGGEEGGEGGGEKRALEEGEEEDSAKKARMD